MKLSVLVTKKLDKVDKMLGNGGNIPRVCDALKYSVI